MATSHSVINFYSLKKGTNMKLIILTGLVLGSLSITAMPINAQTDSNKETAVQKPSTDNLINTLNSATQTKPENLIESLIGNIGTICYNRECSTSDVDHMVSSVVDAVGSDSPLISDFLQALALYGADADTITLAAINYGIDATIASQATAAGGAAPLSAPRFSLPNRSTPSGSGGSGGDSGISESEN